MLSEIYQPLEYELYNNGAGWVVRRRRNAVLDWEYLNTWTRYSAHPNLGYATAMRTKWGAKWAANKWAKQHRDKWLHNQRLAELRGQTINLGKLP